MIWPDYTVYCYYFLGTTTFWFFSFAHRAFCALLILALAEGESRPDRVCELLAGTTFCTVLEEALAGTAASSSIALIAASNFARSDFNETNTLCRFMVGIVLLHFLSG